MPSGDSSCPLFLCPFSYNSDIYLLYPNSNTLPHCDFLCNLFAPLCQKVFWFLSCVDVYICAQPGDNFSTNSYSHLNVFCAALITGQNAVPGSFCFYPCKWQISAADTWSMPMQTLVLNGDMLYPGQTCPCPIKTQLFVFIKGLLW